MRHDRAALAGFHSDSPPVQPPEAPEIDRAGFMRSLSDLLHLRQISRNGDVSQEKPPPSPQINLRAELDVEQAMSYVLAHKNFSYNFLGRVPSENSDDELKGNFETLDSLEVINVSITKSETLWRLEAERLVVGINNAGPDHFLPEMCIPDGDYSLLTSLARELWFMVIICRVFNEIAIIEEMPESHEDDNFQKACYDLRHENASAESRKIKEKTENSTDPQQQALEKEQRQKSIFALIDYITLTLGRILIHSAPRNDTWCYTCLSSLVKYATKLKVLTKNPTGFAAAALRNAEDIAMFSRDSTGNNNQNRARPGGPAGLLARLNQQNTHRNDQDALHQVYYGHNMAIRKQLETFVRVVIQGLMGETFAGTPRTAFEICSVVYETGLQRFRTWVYQERDGDLQATACQKTIPMAQPAFQLLQDTARALQTAQKLQSQVPPRKTKGPLLKKGTRQLLRTHLHWNEISCDGVASSVLSDTYGPAHSVEIRTLADAVIIMVPLLFVSPVVLTDLPDIFQIMTKFGGKFSQTEPQARPTEPKKFKAFFSLFTDGQIDINKRIGCLDASSLSRGLMTRDSLLLGTKIVEFQSRSLSQEDVSKARRQQVDNALEMDRSNCEMDKWIFEEAAVLVNCKLYVWTTMTFATLLAVCGVIVGFTVRGRVEAVDPFNITTYCWVLAAFCILVAKSVRVETWPWRDFLHGHVRCRSVTELQSVTGIPEDVILCKLLDAEETSILNTRGPYNASFCRKSGGGFSIDRPLTMWTMLLSGLIMVKVDTDRGPTLVCLEARRGTTYVSVGHTGNMKSRNKAGGQLVCTNLVRSDAMLPLKREVVDWNRVVGLYNNGKAKFV